MGTRKARAAAVAVGLGLCFALVAAAPALAAPGTIEGLVTEVTEGEGQAEVEVCARPATAADPPGRCVLSEDGSGAGPRGHYALAGLDPGSYKLRFQPPPESIYAYQYYSDRVRLAEADAVAVGSGATVAGVDAVLEVGGIVAGKVTDTGGVPLEGVRACVFALREPEFGFHCDRTRANGTYEVFALQSGSYLAYFGAAASRNFFPQYFEGASRPRDAREFPVRGGETTLGIDAALEAGVAITGAVTEAGTGRPLAGIEACALDPVSEAERRCARSGPDGRYELPGLHRGAYVVGFSVARDEGGFVSGEDGFVRQYYEDEASFAAADRIAATVPGLYQDVDAHLVRGAEAFPGRRPAALAPPPVTAQPPPRPPRRRCAGHKRRKRVKGKARCVRVHKRHHRRHRRSGHRHR